MNTLTVLLPATSRGHTSLQGCLANLRRLGDSLATPDAKGTGVASNVALDLSVCVGVDEDDSLATCVQEVRECFRIPVHVQVFSVGALAPKRAAGAPICWMWGQLAAAARREFGSEWTLLLGDDVAIEPREWAPRLAGFMQQHPHLRCIALLDEADPGFPSFLALHTSSHLDLFGGRLLPEAFVNQGGDPWLFELYRRFGLSGVCPSVWVSNGIGGMEGSVFTSDGTHVASPRYSRHALQQHVWLSLLRSAQQQLADSLNTPPRMQVSVLVPTYRVNPRHLQHILDACCTTHVDVDIRLLVQVDNPKPSASVLAWLQQAQLRRLEGLRVRINSCNVGAAETRNRLLDEACGVDYVIFWDDDITPLPGCIDAYVESFKKHPEDAGFAGPSFLPRLPTKLLPTAIHMSDVSFFWEAPASMPRYGWSHVPWAVTANLAAKHCWVRFRQGFPKAGGGEDVDFCLLLGARLRAVPGAAVEHPWWEEGRPQVYMRFARWAFGDGRLLDLWPQHTYRRAPNLQELCCLAAAPLLLSAGLRAMRLTQLGYLLAGALLADLCIDILGNCCSPERCHQQPCTPWLRPLAAAEAWVVKAFSEAGRAWGHLRRGRLGNLCRSFDWFCGMDAGVVRREQVWAGVRCAILVAGGLLAQCWRHGGNTSLSSGEAGR